MTLTVLQKWKGFFSSNGAKTAPETANPYYSDSEKKLIKQGRADAHARVAEKGKALGIEVHPKIAARRKLAAAK
jgi:hypothetical protein